MAVRLRDIYRSEFRHRIEERVSDEFIKCLVESVTAGFRGDVGIVPRQFLREFVNQLDLVHEHEDYIPMEAAGFEPAEFVLKRSTP